MSGYETTPPSRSPTGEESPLLKVCGFTDLRDLGLAISLGVWAVGFILADSPRRVEPSRLAELTAFLRTEGGTDRPLAIGVFAGDRLDRVVEIVEAADLDGVQLHGAEAPEEVVLLRQRLGDRLLIRAVGVPPRSEEPGLRAALVDAAVAPYAGIVDYVLLDTAVRGRAGGSGVSFDWSLGRVVTDRMPVLVAGGIGPDNARQALIESGAAGLDACSRIEESPGRKNPQALTGLVAAVRDAGAVSGRTGSSHREDV